MNPNHIKWTPKLRAKAIEITKASGRERAAQEMSVIIGIEVSIQSLCGAINYEKVRERHYAKKAAGAAEKSARTRIMKRPCLNQCGKIINSTGPGHRLCYDCNHRLSSLPMQFA